MRVGQETKRDRFFGIKPCPFCARQPEIKEFVNHKGMTTSFAIICKCGAEAPKDSTSRAGIIRIWNRRRYNPTPMQLIEALAQKMDCK